MFDFHEKRKIRAIVYSKVFIALVVIVGVFIARSAYERYVVEREMAEKRDEKFSELETLDGRYQNLEREITRLKNERGIEEELRNRFDAVREGEEVVVILGDTAQGAVAHDAVIPLSATDTPPRTPWWSFLNVLKPD